MLLLHVLYVVTLHAKDPAILLSVPILCLGHQEGVGVEASPASIHHGVLATLGHGCPVVAGVVMVSNGSVLLGPASHVLEFCHLLPIDCILVCAVQAVGEGASFLKEQASLFVHFHKIIYATNN